ncbi:MAG: 5-dehydro-4-deoxy-D-glucuronate isomerase [Saprospiraceae bacterium]
MALKFEKRYTANPTDFKTYDTERIRQDFLIKSVMVDGEINLTYTHYDRFIAGGAVPTEQDLELTTIDPLKATYFLERRELGIINVGGKGSVHVDGKKYPLNYKEALYVGKGSKEVIFSSDDPKQPAHFYLNSAPAHQAYPTKLITEKESELVHLGSIDTANERTIRKLIVSSIVDVCQLQMGMTELKKGSVWNTIPAHNHDRRMEVYFYFEVPEDQAVVHFMGQTHETRHIWMHNEQAVISPEWSIHAGSGTAPYTFIWGMAGENLDYGDMDVCAIKDMK